MEPGHMLAKGHGILDYVSTSSVDTTSTSGTATSQSTGFIYVETDRYLPKPEPPFAPRVLNTEDEKIQAIRSLKTWAAEPLNELRFLRRIAENKPEKGDGFTAGTDAGSLMAGCVVWAPFHIPHAWFAHYLKIAEEVAGPALWDKVVGFRYLLQGKGSEEVKRLAENEDFLENILDLRSGRTRTGRKIQRGWTFDVGVDAHRDGVEVVEYVTGMVEAVRTRERDSPEEGAVTFVLSESSPSLSVAHVFVHSILSATFSSVLNQW
jgi:L-rhamnono-1,4-lactonase